MQAVHDDLVNVFCQGKSRGYTSADRWTKARMRTIRGSLPREIVSRGPGLDVQVAPWLICLGLTSIVKKLILYDELYAKSSRIIENFGSLNY